MLQSLAPLFSFTWLVYGAALEGSETRPRCAQIDPEFHRGIPSPHYGHSRLSFEQRGLILHGLPGNGKTISIKALMHSLSQRSPPIPTLYVKSIEHESSQGNIREIFVKARHNAPCLLVLEDIDSLVTDKVKSFFLNEIDGLEGNDGIMIIGTTNYCESETSAVRFNRRKVLNKLESLF